MRRHPRSKQSPVGAFRIHNGTLVEGRDQLPVRSAQFLQIRRASIRASKEGENIMPQQRVRYFDANGVEVSEQTATRHGVLQSGYALRVPTTLRDHAPRFSDARSFWDQHRDTLCVVDSRRIGGTEGNKPGYRVLDHDFGRAEREAAYRDFEAYLNDSWRQPVRDAFGSIPYTGAAEGGQCTVDGRPGRLVKEGNALVCRPISAEKPRRDPEEDDDDDEDDDDMPQGELEQMTRATSDRRVLDVDTISANHQQRMQQLYDAHARELSEAWKGNK
jgi:hypothetical protein